MRFHSQGWARVRFVASVTAALRVVRVPVSGWLVDTASCVHEHVPGQGVLLLGDTDGDAEVRVRPFPRSV